jgi:hypothetical protein
MVQICKENNWEEASPKQNTIFVICPGAGTARNRKAYQVLEKNFNIIYFAKSGGLFDRYPDFWENNSFVESQGNHLGGIAELIENKIIKDKIIPSCIIAGSRGGQVTVGKVWESIWRGPTIIINAGCLTSQTIIPKEVHVLFIIMGNDYFKSVNTPQKVTKLLEKYKKKDAKTNIIYLRNHYHMPNLNKELVELLLHSYLFLTHRINIPLPIEFY